MQEKRQARNDLPFLVKADFYMFLEKEGKLIYSYDGETVCIEAWGEDAVRVRATKNQSFTGRDWELEEKDAHAGEVEIFEDPAAKGRAFANMYEGTDTSYGKITNGKIHAVIDSGSVITFYNQDEKVLLKEHFRRLCNETSMPLNIMGREYSNGVGENFRIAARFVARKGEKIFGRGQYQQHELDLKGCMLELAQRNSQVSVPFYMVQCLDGRKIRGRTDSDRCSADGYDSGICKRRTGCGKFLQNKII